MNIKSQRLTAAIILTLIIVTVAYFAALSFSRVYIRHMVIAKLSSTPLEAISCDVKVTHGSLLTLSGYNISIKAKKMIAKNNIVFASANLNLYDLDFNLQQRSATSKKDAIFDASINKSDLSTLASILLPSPLSMLSESSSDVKNKTITKDNLRSAAAGMDNNQLKSILAGMEPATMIEILTGMGFSINSDEELSGFIDSLTTAKMNRFVSSLTPEQLERLSRTAKPDVAKKLSGSTKSPVRRKIELAKPKGSYVNISDIFKTEGIMKVYLTLSNDGKQINIELQNDEDSKIILENSKLSSFKKRINPIFDAKSINQDIVFTQISADDKMINIKGRISAESVRIK